jgi:hypothetical protein
MHLLIQRESCPIESLTSFIYAHRLSSVRAENPGTLIVIRFWGPENITWLSEGDLMQLSKGLLPLAIIGSGRVRDPRTGALLSLRAIHHDLKVFFAGATRMLTTLHATCSLEGKPLSSYIGSKVPGLYIDSVGFDYTSKQLSTQAMVAGAVFFGGAVLLGPWAAVPLGAKYIGSWYVSASLGGKVLAGSTSASLGVRITRWAQTAPAVTGQELAVHPQLTLIYPGHFMAREALMNIFRTGGAPFGPVPPR